MAFLREHRVGVWGGVVAALALAPSVALAEAAEIPVHLAPYVLGNLGGLPLTSTLLTSWVVLALLLIMGYAGGRKLALVPGKVQSVCEMVVGGAFDYTANVLENKDLARRYFPIIMTIFVFVLAMNWLGLLPGVTSIGIFEEHEGVRHLIPFLYPAATDLNVTIAFALVAFVTTEFAGVAAIGVWRYAGKFFNFHSPLAFAIGLIEFVSELVRLVAFSFRLFGNIFAGKVLLLVVMALATPYVVPVPLMAYELFVGFIQAFIFAILTLYFIKLAITEPH